MKFFIVFKSLIMKKYNLLLSLLFLLSNAYAQQGWFFLGNSRGGNQVFFVDDNYG